MACYGQFRPVWPQMVLGVFVASPQSPENRGLYLAVANFKKNTIIWR